MNMEMRRALLLMVFIFIGYFCQAQDKEKKMSSSNKTVESATLLDEAESIYLKNPSKALDVLEDALSSSIANKDIIHEARCYLLMAVINENIHEWNLAATYYEKAYVIFSQQKDYSEETIQSLSGLGNAYLEVAAYNQAISSFQSLLRIAENPDIQVAALLKISEAYFLQGNYQQALSYTEQAEKVVQGRKIRKSYPEIQNQKARIYARMNELEKAQEAFGKGMTQEAEVDRDENTTPEAGVSYKSKAEDEISRNLRSQNRYQEEIDFRSQNIQQKISSNNLKDLSKEKVELGELLAETGSQERAINELKEAVMIADSIGDNVDKADAYLSLADAYRNNGDHQNAMHYYKLYGNVTENLLHEKDSQLLSRTEIIRKQKKIEEQTRDFTIGEQSYQLLETRRSLEQSMIARQRIIIYGLVFLMLILAITSYFIYKNARASQMANQLLALKSLRSQMNPHFIFNALNSVNQFISQNDERAANKFLSEFSKLMRLVLDHSEEDFITLRQEKEIIDLYLKLEQYRFREKFDYSVEMEKNIDPDLIQVPPMLIQPYIENAVWHGLRYKQEFGDLKIEFRQLDHMLVVTVVDDGIGRKKSLALKTENQKLHHSKGLKNIEERLKILNKIYKTHYEVSVEDLDANTSEGTIVTIRIPINNHG